ncbi:MAG: tetratricopeptide repeat protein [Bacteroidetes bacterium]|nr:tetratricopeptide repeat protein [Bacteroidota bacterium]
MPRSWIAFVFFILCFEGIGQDSSNIFLKAFAKIENGDTNFFISISHDKEAGSNFAYYLCKAKLYGDNTGRISAFELYKKAIQIAGNNRDKAIANIKTGIYFMRNDLLIPALQYLNKAELLYQFTEDEPAFVELNRNIGLINSYLGSKDKAVARFIKVFRVAKKKGNKKLLASSANNIAIGYIDIKNFNEAEKYLNISLELRIESNDKFLMGQSYNNFGALYFEKGDYEKAILYYNKGYLLRKNYSSVWTSITESEINLGKTYLKLNKIREAEQILLQAYEQSKNAKHVKFISLCTFYLKDIYLQKKDFERAYGMQELYQAAQDSLYGYAKTDAVNRLTIENEFKGKILSDSLAILKQQGEIKSKEARNRRNTTMLMALGAVLILVLLLVLNLFRQKKNEQQKNLLISNQANELREQHKEIKDSINYACNLQQSLLPSNNILEDKLREYFILYLPKDVVSGDFYWANTEQDNSLFFLALADCTGHGVPGAMVSVVGITSLTRCVKEFGLTEPAKILDKLSMLVSEAFSHNDKQLNDGMDISFLSIKKSNNSHKLKWSGANNPLWIIREGQLIEFKGTRRPVGAFINDLPFKQEETELLENDIVYLVTDGFGDQFGGQKGKKFKQGRLKELLLSIHNLPLSEQKERLVKSFDEWKSKHEQIDDVSVIGFKI